MTALPVPPSVLPERKITLRFARFGAVCMHCVPGLSSGGSSSTMPDPPTNVDKARVRKPLSSSSNKLKNGHRRCFSATSQGMHTSKECAVLSAFESLTLGGAKDESPLMSPNTKFRRLVSTEMPPTPLLGPTIRKEPEIPAFSDLDCDTLTPSSECISPPPMEL